MLSSPRRGTELQRRRDNVVHWRGQEREKVSLWGQEAFPALQEASPRWPLARLLADPPTALLSAEGAGREVPGRSNPPVLSVHPLCVNPPVPFNSRGNSAIPSARLRSRGARVRALQTPGSSAALRGTRRLPAKGPGLVGKLGGPVKKLALILQEECCRFGVQDSLGLRGTQGRASVAGRPAGAEPGEGLKGLRRGRVLSRASVPGTHPHAVAPAGPAGQPAVVTCRATPGSDGEPRPASAHWPRLSFGSHSPGARVRLCPLPPPPRRVGQAPAAEPAPLPHNQIEIRYTLILPSTVAHSSPSRNQNTNRGKPMTQRTEGGRGKKTQEARFKVTASQARELTNVHSLSSFLEWPPYMVVAFGKEFCDTAMF
ncbi:hypothetical protein HJG60_008541 [Phyllostomus discolor]|uniref:Uncharacterized protein n=1 Tax=Phyllostomus discolor TaxID=89673 RepID=A0A834DNI1_9CHIR|nr:hypothetical protein HJG60_008541 [Phyllostomus discolor]